MKLVQGTCFNISISQTSEGTKQLFIQIRANDGNIWKFHMGKAFDKTLLTDYNDIYKVMNAKSITISTEDTSRGSILTLLQQMNTIIF